MKARWAISGPGLLFGVVAVIAAAPGSDGVVHVKSKYSVTDTIARADRILQHHGLRVFGVVDHDDEARKNKQALPATKLLVFGVTDDTDAKLMQANRLIGLDLPNKLLVWEDDKGLVWVSYTSAEYLALRHRLDPKSDLMKKVTIMLREVGNAVAK